MLHAVQIHQGWAWRDARECRSKVEAIKIAQQFSAINVAGYRVVECSKSRPVVWINETAKRRGY